MQIQSFLLSIVFLTAIACGRGTESTESQSTLSLQGPDNNYVAPKCNKPDPYRDSKSFAAEKDGKFGLGMMNGFPIVDGNQKPVGLVLSMQYQNGIDPNGKFKNTHRTHVTQSEMDKLLAGGELKQSGNFRNIRVSTSPVGKELVYAVTAEYATGDSTPWSMPYFNLRCTSPLPKNKLVRTWTDESKNNIVKKTETRKTWETCKTNVMVDIKHAGSHTPRDIQLVFDETRSTSIKVKNTIAGPSLVTFRRQGTYNLIEVNGGEDYEQQCRILGIVNPIKIQKYDGFCHANQNQMTVQIECKKRNPIYNGNYMIAKDPLVISL